MKKLTSKDFKDGDVAIVRVKEHGGEATVQLSRSSSPNVEDEWLGFGDEVGLFDHQVEILSRAKIVRYVRNSDNT